MTYIDGFVFPVSRKNLAKYRSLARRACKVWMDHGALHYLESVGDDLHGEMGLPFPKGLKIKKGETVAFSWVLYKSRAHRDRVNAKVMKDPRLIAMSKEAMPFDVKRMMYGGFKAIVEAKP